MGRAAARTGREHSRRYPLGVAAPPVGGPPLVVSRPDRRPHLRGEPDHVAHIVERQQPEPEQLLRHEQVPQELLDRKSTRLNSSHDQISYAVFCLKKKKKTTNPRPPRADSTST